MMYSEKKLMTSSNKSRKETYIIKNSRCHIAKKKVFAHTCTTFKCYRRIIIINYYVCGTKRHK